MCLIYKLICPITNNVLYIGYTRTSLKKRLSAHLSKRKNNYQTEVYKWYIKNNIKPLIYEVEKVSEDNWQDREKYWISFYKKDFKLLNKANGGVGGGRLGLKNTKEHNNKISKSNRKPRLNKSNFGLKKKIPIIQYDLNDNFIKEWDSALDAFRGTGIWKESIRNCCNGRSKTSGGFKWKYKFKIGGNNCA